MSEYLSGKVLLTLFCPPFQETYIPFLLVLVPGLFPLLLLHLFLALAFSERRVFVECKRGWRADRKHKPGELVALFVAFLLDLVVGKELDGDLAQKLLELQRGPRRGARGVRAMRALCLCMQRLSAALCRPTTHHDRVVLGNGFEPLALGL